MEWCWPLKFLHALQPLDWISSRTYAGLMPHIYSYFYNKHVYLTFIIIFGRLTRLYGWRVYGDFRQFLV